MNKRNWRLKYSCEWLLAFVCFLLIAPFLVMIAALVKITSTGPIFYISRRIGRYGREFNLYKFRSMHINSPQKLGVDGKVLTLKEDTRLTPIGKLLRLGFDELPQLFNILKGDMCLIGPRPDVPDELEKYTNRQRLRLRVLPGITGLAAVVGGRFCSNAWNYEMDVRYIEFSSGWTDLAILFLTIPYSLGCEGIGEWWFRALCDNMPD